MRLTKFEQVKFGQYGLSFLLIFSSYLTFSLTMQCQCSFHSALGCRSANMLFLPNLSAQVAQLPVIE